MVAHAGDITGQDLKSNPVGETLQCTYYKFWTHLSLRVGESVVNKMKMDKCVSEKVNI
jgi:hypothetical protein